jgi:hypothetical protein
MQLNEAIGRGTITGSGQESIRHEAKYITPHIGSEEYTHKLVTKHEDIPAGSKLRIHKAERLDGKLYVHASDDNTREVHRIPVTKIEKPGEAPKNEGHNYELATFERFKKAGITPANATHAGSTAGTDVPIENKKRKMTHKGCVNHGGDILSGEVKEGTSAAMGQLTINHTPEKGWHITDKARKNRPKYAETIEKAGLLEHMNKTQDPDKHHIETTASGRAKTLTVKHPDLKPAVSYLKDHHVDVLHVGSGYGTFRVGAQDVTGHGLPSIKGRGKFVIREKQAGNKRARTIAFHPDGVKGLVKSHINLDDDEHLEHFARTLGHRN